MVTADDEDEVERDAAETRLRLSLLREEAERIDEKILLEQVGFYQRRGTVIE